MIISLISTIQNDNDSLIIHALAEQDAITDNTTTNDNSDCTSIITQQMNTQNSAIDKDRAISLANSSDEFKLHVRGYNYTFNSIFTTGSWEPVTCTKYRTDTVNVVFSVYDHACGNYLKYTVVTEDPTLARVMNVTDQVGNGHFGGSGYNTNSTCPIDFNTRQMISDEEMKRMQDTQNQTNNTMYMIGIGAAIAGVIGFITLRKVAEGSKATA